MSSQPFDVEAFLRTADPAADIDDTFDVGAFLNQAAGAPASEAPAWRGAGAAGSWRPAGELGFVDELARGARRGWGGVVEGLGGALYGETAANLAARDRWFPANSLGIPDAGAAAARETLGWSDRMREYGRGVQQAPENERSTAAEGLHPGRAAWWAAGLGEQGVQLLGQVGLLAATRGRSAATQFAAFAAPTVALEGGHQFNETYDALRAAGVPDDEAIGRARTAAGVTGAGAGALEAVPFAGLTGRLPGARGAALRILAAAAGEGVQEAGQEVLSTTVRAAATGDAAQFRGLGERAATGALLGTALGGAVGAVGEGRPRADPATRQTPPPGQPLETAVPADPEAARRAASGPPPVLTPEEAAVVVVPSPLPAPDADASQRVEELVVEVPGGEFSPEMLDAHHRGFRHGDRGFAPAPPPDPVLARLYADGVEAGQAYRRERAERERAALDEAASPPPPAAQPEAASAAPPQEIPSGAAPGSSGDLSFRRGVEDFRAGKPLDALQMPAVDRVPGMYARGWRAAQQAAAKQGDATSTETATPPERVVAAAVRTPSGRHFVGSWHFEAGEAAREAGAMAEGEAGADGFWTDRGRFLSRQEAADLIRENQQKDAVAPRAGGMDAGNFTNKAREAMPRGEVFLAGPSQPDLPANLFGEAEAPVVEQAGLFAPRDLAAGEKAAADRVSARPMNADEVLAATREGGATNSDPAGERGLFDDDLPDFGRSAAPGYDINEPAAARTPARPDFQDTPPPARLQNRTYAQAREGARNLSDAELERRHGQNLRNAILHGAVSEASPARSRRIDRDDKDRPIYKPAGPGVEQSRWQATNAEARVRAYENELRARGLEPMAADDAFGEVVEDDLPEELRPALQRARAAETASLTRLLLDAERRAAAMDPGAVAERYIIAGEMRRRGIDVDEDSDVAAQRALLPSAALPDVIRPNPKGTGQAEKRSAILADLSAKLNVPFRRKRFRGSALGIYKENPQVVRTRMANDVETIAHEVGHHVQNLLYGRIRSGDLRQWRAELYPLSLIHVKPSTAEGWAEFWRRYLTNPDAARARAPQTYADVEQMMRAQAPEALDAILAARARYAQYLKADPQSRIHQQVSLSEDRPRPGLRDVFSRAHAAVFDHLAPLVRLQNDLTGGDAAFEEDAVQAARLVSGAAGAANVFLEMGVLDWDTKEVVGPSLKEALSPVTGDAETFENFRDYAVARRAQELMRRGLETGFEQADADAVVQRYGGDARFAGAFDQLVQYQNGMLAYLRDAGVLTPDTYAAVTQQNLDYIPFLRVKDAERLWGGGVGKKMDHLFSPIKRVRGSSSDIVDPIESIIRNTYLYTNLAARQQVSNRLAKMAEIRGAGRLIEKIEAPLDAARVSVREALDGLKAQGVNVQAIRASLSDPELDEVFMVYRPGDYFRDRNVISVIEDGKRVWYEVGDPDVYEALAGLSEETAEAWLRVLSKPAAWLRAGATLSPEFILRNPPRDQLTAWMQSEHGYLPFVDMARGAFHYLRADDLYRRWRATGGEFAAMVDMDRSALQRQVSDFERSGKKIPNVVRHPLALLQAISAFTENATKLGEYANVERRLKKQGVRGRELYERAAAASREVNIDFARHGAKTKSMRMMATFWNARLQGYASLARAARAHPARFATKAFFGITLPSLLLAFLNQDEEGWDEIPQWQKDTFWLVHIGGGEDGWLRIPKPFELGLVFGSIPERAMEWALKEDPDGFGRAVKDFVENQAWGSLPIPTIFLPMIENAANRDFFFNRPVVPRRSAEAEPEYQVGGRESETAKGLGRILNYSPAKLENVFRDWTGSVGSYGLAVVEYGARKAGISDPPPAPQKSLAERPVVKAFMVAEPGFGSESIDRFFSRLEQVRDNAETAEFLKREGRAEEYREYVAKHRAEIQEAKRLGEVAKDLGGFFREARQVRDSRTMTPEAKRRRLEVLARGATRAARAALPKQ